MPGLTIAITGATGFVGQALVPKLLERGHKVRALVRKPGRVAMPMSAQLVVGDLADLDALQQLCHGADAVLHLAGAIKAAGRAGFFEANQTGTRNLAEAAIDAGVRRFVHVSSLAARRPELSPYAASKRAAEDSLIETASAVTTLILRPSAVYGPGDMATLPLLKALMAPLAVLPGRSDARFSLIHVDDLAAVLADAVEGAQSGLVEVDDLSGGHGWDELAQITREAFGRPGRVVHVPYGLALGLGYAADALAGLTGKAQMVSAGKFREMYEPDWRVEGRNWPRKAPISLAEGLPQTIRWYQAQGLLPQTGTVDRSRPHTGPQT